MCNNETQSLINEYNELLSNLNELDIKALELGFINNNCNAKVFTILIHCMENIEIFDEFQINNIYNCINKINYEL